MTEPECKCPRLRIGMIVSDIRNLSPNCPIHKEEYEEKARKLFGDDR